MQIRGIAILRYVVEEGNSINHLELLSYLNYEMGLR